VHQHLLAEPVEYGDIRLAPTTELAALAELSSASTPESRLDVIVRAAAAIRSEDAARHERTQARRAAEAGVLVLPSRR
jgi:hypothetical protein